MDKKPYGLLEHRHRFAVWAAARAAQRAFTSVVNLREALESTEIQTFLEQPESLQTSQESYERNHRNWCNQIVEFLENRSIANVTFGRAAKLVAVYVKTMIVISSHAHTNLATNAHPPIDSVLLKNLAGPEGVQSPHNRYWRTIAWTKLDEESYYQLIVQLRAVLPPDEPFWMLENYWNVTND